MFAAQSAVFAEPNIVPVIVLFTPGASLDIERGALASAGGEVTHVYEIINAVAARLPSASIDGLKRNPHVLSVDYDAEVNALNLGADQQIHADQVWANGYAGSGVSLAILDTGIAKSHPEFVGRIAFCESEVTGITDCEDDEGHGTHVAGLAGASGEYGSAKGVAPSVTFMIDKVLNSQGSGSISQIISGIEWAVTNDADIISMSLGTSSLDNRGTKANCDTAIPSLTLAINNAVAAGVTVVAAAGNAGAQGLGAPGCISSVIAVGAVDSSDNIASWSSRGAAMRDHGVAAPGVSLLSTYLNGGYAYMSGTSMATPVVSGTIALMLEANSSFQPSDIKAKLFSSADCLNNKYGTCPNNYIGYGRVNALQAVTPSLPPTPFITLSANPSTIPISQTSTITASTSDITGDVAITFTTTLGLLSQSSCTTISGSCTVSLSSSTTGTATITGSASGYTQASTSVNILDSTLPLSVSVSTNKPSYKKGNPVMITVTVSASETPVPGALVSLKIIDPSENTLALLTATTDSTGVASFKYTLSRSADSGSYIASATASKIGYTDDSDSNTFDVK